VSNLVGWAQLITALAAFVAAVGSIVNGQRIKRAHGEATRAADEATLAHARIEEAIVINGNGDEHAA